MKNQKEKLRKQSYSPLQQKEQKYLGINLPEETKDLYSVEVTELTDGLAMGNEVEREIGQLLGLGTKGLELLWCHLLKWGKFMFQVK